jgi:hypothetical protein
MQRALLTKNYPAFAAQKFYPITLTGIQQEENIFVAAPLFYLSVNLRPDFCYLARFFKISPFLTRE